MSFEVTTVEQAPPVDPARTLGRVRQWDSASEEYARKFSDIAGQAYADAEANIIISALETAPGKRVLELCCGAGRNTRRVVDAGFDVTAIDLAPGILRKAGEAPCGRYGSVRFQRTKTTVLPFREQLLSCAYTGRVSFTP